MLELNYWGGQKHDKWMVMFLYDSWIKYYSFKSKIRVNLRGLQFTRLVLLLDDILQEIWSMLADPWKYFLVDVTRWDK